MRRLALVLAVVATSSRPLPCVKKDASAGGVDAASSSPTAKQSPPSSASAAPTVTAPPPDPTLETARDLFGAVEWDVSHGVLKDKARTDEPDAVAKCATLDDLRPRLATHTEPEVVNLLEESKRLCSFDVPILSASETLRQVTISPSQASRRLMCGFAKKDIAKARSVKADDRRVRELDHRWQQTCQ